MAKEIVVKNLGLGVVTIPADPELIPQQASQDSLGFISTDGQIELCRGRLLVGAEETANGFVKGHGFGYRADGTAVQFRKVNTKIQYYNTTTSLWVDIITGLTASAEYTFSPHISPAGTFIYATGADGIYKIHVANPGSYTSMYDSAKNFKGKSIIGTTGEASRMFMWDVTNDKTGLYLSNIDKADSSVYTSVTGEATAAATSGTLAFKAGDAKRTCFLVVITITATGQVFTDDKNGNLVGSLGGTGTINYTTGAWTLSTSSAGTAAYFWEMTNNKGVTDFTHSATRLAGEGNIFRQDEGGDPIQTLHVFEGIYFSIKSRSVYSSVIATTDLSAQNLIFRKDIGLPYWRASVVTGKGIMFMNTSNLLSPQLTILQKNLNGDNLEPATLAKQFDFSNYVWDMCAMATFGEFVVFSGRTPGSQVNNRMFLYNVTRDTVDILPYSAKTIVPNGGLLYIGDTQTDNVYEVLSGFDDDNDVITNYWISNDEKYGAEYLKKLKRLRLKGIITPNQVLEVYMDTDNDGFGLIGTIRGDATYVDTLENYDIGSHGIGTSVIGGETDYLDGGVYFMEIKVSSTKFRKRTLKLVATGIGYVSVSLLDDFNIKTFPNKLPSKYRQKNNVSLDGTLTDQ